MKTFIILILSISFYLPNVYSFNPVDIIETDTVEVEVVEMPFDFGFILGETKYSSKVGNTLTDKYLSGIITTPYENFSSKYIIIGRLYEKSFPTSYGPDQLKKYFEAYYNGKQFYIDFDDVKLDDEMKLRLDTLSNCSDEIQEEFRYKAKRLAIYDNLKKSNQVLDYFKKHKTYGLSVLEWHIYDESEYTEGTGLKIEVLNPTNKTIKYITINIVGYNPVNDKVLSKGKYTQTVKCVGPIESDKSGSYKFEYVWFTDLVNTAKISSIVVEYMDGSVKTINNVKQITWNTGDYEYLLENYPNLKDIEP